MEIDRFAEALYQAGCFTFKDTCLTSDRVAPLYFDSGPLRSILFSKKTVVEIFAEIARSLKFDLLADVPTRPTVLVSSLADFLQIPQITPRMETKQHGRKDLIIGVFQPRQRVSVVEDAVTTGGSILKVVQILRETGLVVRDSLALIDWQKGGAEALEAQGVRLHIPFLTSEIFEYYARFGLYSQEEIDLALNYLRS